MNNKSAEISSQAWHDAESGDYQAPKKRRKSHRGGRNHRRSNEQVETEISRPHKYEYKASELGTALIWARDPKDAEQALIRPDTNNIEPADHLVDHMKLEASVDIPNDSLQPYKDVDEYAPDKKQPVEHETLEASEIDQPLEQMPASPDQVAEAHAFATLNHEPNPDMQRAYFWNTIKSSQELVDHDELPSVASAEDAAQQTDELSRSVLPKQPDPPKLERAINPNLDNLASNHQTKHKEYSSRHLEAPAVQSQQMTAHNFEQLAAEPVSDETGMPNELYVQDEFAPQPSIEPESAIDTPSPLETTDWPGFGSPQSESIRSASSSDLESGPIDHTLENSELLTLARSINIDGVSVYEMFAANRIDEDGLRKIVSSYLRGKELRQTIAQEIVRQQMKFERDPQLRDTPVKISDAESPSSVSDRVKQGTMTLLDPEFAKEQTEKIGELTQNAIEKSQEFFGGGANIGRFLSIAAIVIIYTLIIIVALSK